MKDEFPIRLTEELVLLMLNEQTGYLEMVPGWDFSCVMAGAVIADLALEHRIDTDLEALHLMDPTPTGDRLLDPTLKEISETDEALETQYWIERNTARREEIVTLTLQRLVDKQILDYETGGFWTLSRVVSRSGTYPTADGTMRAEAKARVLGVILNDVIPDPRDVILVGLMHTCDGFKLLLSEEDYEEKLERIEDVSRMDLVGRSVSSAVRLSTVKPKTRRLLRTKPIPKLRITDILRQRDYRTGNISSVQGSADVRYRPLSTGSGGTHGARGLRTLWPRHTPLPGTPVGRAPDGGKPPAHRLPRDIGYGARKLHTGHQSVSDGGSQQKAEVPRRREQRACLKQARESARGEGCRTLP